MANRSIDFMSHFKEIDLPLYGVRLPIFKIENKYKREIGVSEELTNLAFLRSLANAGYKNLKLKAGKPLSTYPPPANHS